MTEDGFEITFQVSALGAALLSELLLPALRKARGRVISINSANMLYANLTALGVGAALQPYIPWATDSCLWPLPVLSDTCFVLGTYSSMWQGSDCMCPGGLAEILSKPSASNIGAAMIAKGYWSTEFARREAPYGVTSHTLHPGMVATPGTIALLDGLGLTS